MCIEKQMFIDTLFLKLKLVAAILLPQQAETLKGHPGFGNSQQLNVTLVVLEGLAPNNNNNKKKARPCPLVGWKFYRLFYRREVQNPNV